MISTRNICLCVWCWAVQDLPGRRRAGLAWSWFSQSQSRALSSLPAPLLPWGAGRAVCSLKVNFFPFLDAAKGFTGQGKKLHPMFVCVQSNAAVSDVLLSACFWSPWTPELGAIGCCAVCPSNDYFRYLQSLQRFPAKLMMWNNFHYMPKTVCKALKSLGT